MRSLEFWILSYLFNSLWQVPLLFAAGWLAARALNSAGAAVQHRVWVITLLLQSLLPACSNLPWMWLRTLPLWGRHAGNAAQAQVSVVMGAGTGLAALPLPGVLLTTVAIVYSTVSAYFVARFLWRGAALSRLRNESVGVNLTGEAASYWAQCAQRFHLNHVSIAASSRIFGPVTMGFRRKLVLLPVSMVDTLPEEDLLTVIEHEFAHMRRNDFMKNLLYEWLSLPAAYHPLLWLTRERIMETREMVCDQMAAAVTGRNEYARSLLRLASLLVKGTFARTPHTIGIFDANAFERRLMKLTDKHNGLRGARRAATVAACALLALATCGAALALAMHVDPASAEDHSSASKPTKTLNVSPEVMSGNLLTKAVPHYPDAAKKAKIQGTVVLSAVIGKDGAIENLRVLSGPAELQKSALDAVRQWTYKPYLLNGDPVEVNTTINIVYSLAG
jgi:TonB family protein